MTSTVLITGITGQDGSLLAEYLADKGYRVVGTVANSTKAVAALPYALTPKVELVECGLLNQRAIIEVLTEYQPSEVFNFAANSSGIGMYDDPVATGEVSGLGVTRILEAIRLVSPKIRLCQASSREVFGEANESPQTEETPKVPRSPYGAAKLYADSMVQIYRKHFDIYACSAILFNHESPRRRIEFVTRKITHTAASIKLGLADRLYLGNLDARRDWGYAGDTVRAMWLMLQQSQADDYIVATGKTHSVREFCECAFNHLELDYRRYITEDASAYRANEPIELVGNSAKAREKLGWFPEVGFEELVHMMVDADLRRLSEVCRAPKEKR